MQPRTHIMKKIIFGLIASCAFQSAHTMEWPSQEGLNNKLIDVAADENLDLMRKLLEDGADVNARNERKTTPLWKALYHSQDAGPTCQLLLEHGADVCAKPYPAETRMLARIAIENPALLTNIILVPNAQALSSSHKLIKTILLCFKRICPQLPKDIRLMILANRNRIKELRWGKDENHIVGNVMIARKLQGLPILDIFKEITIHTLYGSTIRGITNTLQRIIDREEAARPRAIIHGYVITAPAPSLLKSRLDFNTFESTYGEALRKTVITRLEQNKLLCNNPSQAFERERAFIQPDEQIPGKTQKCTIL